MIDAARYESLKWQAVRERCAKDVVYLAENYLRVVARVEMGGGRPRLKFNRVQHWLLDAMQDQHKRTGFVRLVIGKARQVGVSTLCRAIAFQQTVFHSNRNALLITHDEDSSTVMFRTFDKAWLDDLPKELRPPSRVDRRDTIEIAAQKTRSIANHALNQNVGASQTIHMLHYSEATRVTRTAESVWSAVSPSFVDARSGPNGGFLQDHSIGLIESTSRYGGDWFKEIAERAQVGEFGSWEFVFVPWTMLDEYRAAVPSTFHRSSEEHELARRHPHLTDANFSWRRAKKSEYVLHPLTFWQEYPLSWEESWILPAGTDRVFTPDVCADLRSRDNDTAIRPGVRYDVGPEGLTRLINGWLEVWALPEEGVFYDLGIDISGGATSTSDWTVIEVLRRDTLEQVAEARLRINPADQELEDLVYWTGMAYNAAQINPDATSGWGYALTEALQRRSYPNLYLWRQYDSATGQISNRIGFVYNRRSKGMLNQNGTTLAYRGEVTIHSAALLGEMEDYLHVPPDTWEARPGCYDDAVNAWLLALLAARDERGPDILRRPEPAEPEPVWVTKPWAAHNPLEIIEESISSRYDLAPTWRER